VVHAEDGILALYVTGVQTCALPILDERCGPDRQTIQVNHLGYAVIGHGHVVKDSVVDPGWRAGDRGCRAPPEEFDVQESIRADRSEERRVGKEGRSWGRP